MAAPADVIFVDGEIHTLGTPDRTAEAIAVRNGTVCRVADTYEVEFLEGINTRRVELDGRTVVPGFLDGHSHLLRVGFRLRRADLRGTNSLNDALQRLRRDASADREWVLGFGFDETQYPESARPTTKELDSVSENRPVAAFRTDMETVVLNSAARGAVTRFRSKTTAGTDQTPPGVLTGQDAERVWRMIRPERVEGAREYVDAAVAHAHERGVTTVVDTVRDPVVARLYHQLAVAQDLPLRIRVNYQIPSADSAVPADGSPTAHSSQSIESGQVRSLEAVRSLGLVSGVGTEPLRIDSLGIGLESANTPAAADFIRAATKAGFRVTVAVQDPDAVAAVIDAIQDCDAVRPRISYSGAVTDHQLAALAEAGAVVVGQVATPPAAESSNAPDEDGTRMEPTPQFGRLTTAGVPLTFGSNGFEMTPLQDIEAVRNAGRDRQLGVTDAFRAAAGAGDTPMGPGNGTGILEPGAPADFVVLSASPWETSLSDVSVETTVVDGSVVYES